MEVMTSYLHYIFFLSYKTSDISHAIKLLTVSFVSAKSELLPLYLSISTSIKYRYLYVNIF